jgi:hypothetical protein
VAPTPTPERLLRTALRGAERGDWHQALLALQSLLDHPEAIGEQRQWWARLHELALATQDLHGRDRRRRQVARRELIRGLYTELDLARDTNTRWIRPCE